MGGRKRNTGPALETFVTGVFALSAEGGTAFLRRVSLRFFFLSVSLPFDGACRIIKADSKVFSHLTKEWRYQC